MSKCLSALLFLSSTPAVVGRLTQSASASRSGRSSIVTGAKAFAQLRQTRAGLRNALRAGSQLQPAAEATAQSSRKDNQAIGIFDSNFPEVVDEDQMLFQSGFPISPEELIEKAKRYYATPIGQWDRDELAEDFKFMGPVVGPLDRDSFLKAVSGFRLLDAFPDNNARYYHFRVDPFETNRVWTTSRAIGTNTGVFAGTIPPTGKVVESPPQTLSLKFNEEGKITLMTVGYVMDRSVGNTGGLGGVFGYLYAIGKPLPFPEAQPW
eukprot:CAMPEP_0184479038 /NCGR_PEP_ID=MMETSP0113_2-20130426/899_1 /TAXON_ID=91329 /ORGANISM="Norrisiella sphaerica, Strain BC52" /LENGTH=264 /DNA_ID=CAMNT_0026857021 /DNA_START=95 /DNA_END=886 /DNA_ORIENTATION=+